MALISEVLNQVLSDDGKSLRVESSEGTGGTPGKDGERGPAGKDGAKGDTGNPGANGIGIVDITSDDTEITFHLSDSSTKAIPWPTKEG